MQKQSNLQKGYLTVYLSLVFGVILSLILVLVEGAAIGASRLQSELVAEVGMDSVFAEYNKELLKQYNVFFIDDSYGATKGTVGNVRKHLSDYLEINMNPNNKLSDVFFTNLVKLENPYLEIENATFATDDGAQAFKVQAVEYMQRKHLYGIVKDFSKEIDLMEKLNLFDTDVSKQVDTRKKEIDDYFNDNKEIKEAAKDRKTIENSEGFSFEKLINFWDDLKGYGVLDSVVKDKSSISKKQVDTKEYVYYASKNDAINKGCGVPDTVDKIDNVFEEAVFQKYLFDKCGNYIDKKDTGRLNYEIEYIIFGKESDVYNLRECCERIVAIRTAANFIFLNSDEGKYKKEEASTLATVVCTLCMVPELAEPLTDIILAGWAYAESLMDMKCLLQGGNISILKENSEWNLSLIELLTFKAHWGNHPKKSHKLMSLSYQDYLGIFMMMMNKDTKAMRALDIVEMNIRQTEGNENFKIDQCIDYLRVSFGFRDTRKHEFVFTKEMRYE